MKGQWEAVEVGVDEWFLGCREGEGPGDGYSPFLDIGHGREHKEIASMLADCLNACERIGESDVDSKIVEICRKFLHRRGLHVS